MAMLNGLRNLWFRWMTLLGKPGGAVEEAPPPSASPPPPDPVHSREAPPPDEQAWKPDGGDRG